MKKSFVLIVTFLLIVLSSCATTMDMEIATDLISESKATSLEDEIESNKTEIKEFLIQEELKVQDIEETVIYIEDKRPSFFGR